MKQTSAGIDPSIPVSGATSHTERENAGEHLESASGRPSKPNRSVPLYLVATTLGVLVIGGLLFLRSTAHANRKPLSETAMPVAVVSARATEFRAERRYIGAIEPWVEARVGPQLTSAYVDTVLVRPGAVVKRGEVIATLDCRKANAASSAVALQARSLEARQHAVADEATRVSALLDGGFVSPNEAEQKTAETASKEAELLAQKAQLLRATLDVDDCILRAPFDGEVAERLADPGMFAHPGMSVVRIVDRTTVRISADVPESDFDAVAPRTPVSVHAFSTGETLSSTIARRAPAADSSTRTIHIEIDVANPGHRLPVGTTAELRIEVGETVPVAEIPLSCASIRGTRATIFTADHGIAHKLVVDVVGERGGNVCLRRTLAPGTLVVSQGRALLKDGDAVHSTLETETAQADTPKTADSPARADLHGGLGR